MTDTHALIAAAGDAQLLARATAILEARGVTASALASQMGHLVALPVQDGRNIADVYEYASVNRAAALAAVPPEVGTDLAAVTDAHLVTALDQLGLLPAE